MTISKSLAEYRTYSGLHDDVLIRYSDEVNSESFFTKLIVKNVLLGGPIYLNDGYLVNHPIARKQLQQERSLLSVMLATGFIHIYTRTQHAEELCLLPEKMAKDYDNDSFQRLVNSPEWPEFKQTWCRKAKDAFLKGHIRHWPNKNLNQGFTDLLIEIVKLGEVPPERLGLTRVSESECKRIRDRFLDRKPQENSPRDKLEKSAIDVLRDRSDFRMAMNEIMVIGNQTYHYNQGAALATEEPVFTETVFGPAFKELWEEYQVTTDQVANLPVFSLNEGLPIHDGSIFFEFCDTSTRLFQSKMDYLSLLESSLQKDSHDIRKDLAEATRAYQFILNQHFKSITGAAGVAQAIQNGMDVALKRIHDTTFLAVSTSDGNDDRSFMVERLNVVDTGIVPNSSEITIHDVRRQIASLQFKQEGIDDYNDKIGPAPKF